MPHEMPAHRDAQAGEGNDAIVLRSAVSHVLRVKGCESQPTLAVLNQRYHLWHVPLDSMGKTCTL